MIFNGIGSRHDFCFLILQINKFKKGVSKKIIFLPVSDVLI
jgi:hypothetical protein